MHTMWQFNECVCNIAQLQPVGVPMSSELKLAKYFFTFVKICEFRMRQRLGLIFCNKKKKRKTKHSFFNDHIKCWQPHLYTMSYIHVFQIIYSTLRLLLTCCSSTPHTAAGAGCRLVAAAVLGGLGKLVWNIKARHTQSSLTSKSQTNLASKGNVGNRIPYGSQYFNQKQKQHQKDVLFKNSHNEHHNKHNQIECSCVSSSWSPHFCALRLWTQKKASCRKSFLREKLRKII